MAKTKIIFLGSRPLGLFALDKLMKMPDVEVVGCVVREPPTTAWWGADPHNVESIKHVTQDQLSTIDFDLGVSINYWKIIESELIRKPSMGFINLHHSYMLSFRGRDMTTHAIINARKTNRWYHGTTIHYTDDGLDTGPIIASDSCPITEHDTAWSLFEKTESLGRAMLDLWLPRIVGGRPPLATPEPEQPLNLRSDKSTKAISDIFSDPLESYDLVRAYDFNGYYEPASTVIRGDKVYLTTRGDAGGEVLLALGENRSIYKMAHRSAN